MDVDFGLLNSGTWEELPNGDRIWKLKISSPEAYSINLIYSDFFIPGGASLHVYNPLRDHVLGGFTSENNRPGRTFATGLVKGDTSILEYYEPAKQRGKGAVQVSKVIHGYKDLLGKDAQQKDFGESGDCHNNVACSKTGPWRDQVRSVAIILANDNSAVCSGALIHNSSGNTIPYFLTANHCFRNEQDTKNWIFVFNYESPGCAGNSDGTMQDSILGATARARRGGSDFMLLELSSTPPSHYNVYYAGWSRSSSPPLNSFSIHHPAGDVKKISFDQAPPVLNFYEAGLSRRFFNNTHWEVVFDDGVTESGSSGGPLFDDNGRIRGQLHGGFSQCGEPASDYYGSISVSWDLGTRRETRLSDWLDPINSGVMELSGTNGNAGTPSRPETPDPPIFTMRTSSSVEITWRRPTDNGAAISSYELQQRKGEAGTFSTVYSGGTNLSYTSQNLTSGSTYHYRVQASNEVGVSEFSAVSRVVMNDPIIMSGDGSVTGCDRAFLDPGGYDSFPVDRDMIMTLAPTSPSHRVRVTFHSFSLVAVLYIYKGANDGDRYADDRPGIYFGNKLPPVITSDTSDGKLTFRLRVVPSDEVAPRVSEGWEAEISCLSPGIPDTPSEPIFGSVLANSVRLSWEEPDSVGSEISQYVVEQKTGSDGTFHVVSSGSLEALHNATGLTTGKEYFFRVRAVNAIGTSEFSREAGIVARKLRLAMGAGKVQECDIPFLDSGGHRQYAANLDLTFTLAPPQTGQRVRVEFTRFYTERGFDVLKVYEGDKTDSSNFIREMTSALVDEELPLTIASGSADGKLTFRFISDETRAAEGWEAMVTCETAGSTLGRVAAGSPIVMTQVEDPVIVCDRRFLDPGGFGNYQGDLNVTMVLSPKSKAGKVRLNFLSFETGPQLDHLSIYGGSGSEWTRLSGTLPPFQITSEDPDGGLILEFVSDPTSSGNLPGWEAAISCLGPDVPEAPNPPIFGSILEDSIQLIWEPPTSVGSEITRYVVEQRSAADQTFNRVSEGSPNQFYTSTGLTTSQKYFFRIQAINARGASKFSREAGITASRQRLALISGEHQGCDIPFLDPGGHLQYLHNLDLTSTLAPINADQRVRVLLGNFETEQNHDLLYIYHGDRVNPDKLAKTVSGSVNPFFIASQSPDGKLTFRFVSNGSTSGEGWTGIVSCEDAPATLDRSGNPGPPFPEVKVYPNPAAGVIHLELKEGANYSVTLISMAGQVISNQNIEKGGLKTLNVEGVAEGIYILKVEGDRGEWKTFRISVSGT